MELQSCLTEYELNDWRLSTYFPNGEFWFLKCLAFYKWSNFKMVWKLTNVTIGAFLFHSSWEEKGGEPRVLLSSSGNAHSVLTSSTRIPHKQKRPLPRIAHAWEQPFNTWTLGYIQDTSLVLTSIVQFIFRWKSSVSLMPVTLSIYSLTIKFYPSLPSHFHSLKKTYINFVFPWGGDQNTLWGSENNL